MPYHRTPLASAISLVIAAAAAAGSVEAQEQQQQQQAAAQAAQPVLNEVIVTGSRIRRDVFSSPAPVDIVAPSAAATQGIGSVSALLQSTTVAAGSSQVTAATSTAFVQNGGIGAQTLSLRGLGANRTLVLLNGRRAGPAGTRGGVSAFDFNVLPLTTIERVEILKDGASSIYGSDAVAGVVNVITKQGEGLDMDAHVSRPEQSGGEEARFSVSWGKVGERGRFRVTGDYYRVSELAQGDRSYFRCAEQYIFDQNTGQRADVVDPRTGKPACRDLLWGQVWLYNYQSDFTEDGSNGNVPTRTRTLAQYDYDGDLGKYIPPIATDPNHPEYLTTPPGWYLVNYDRPSDAVANMDHPFQDATSLDPKMERTTFFGEGEFEITDSVTAYAEVLLNRRKTKANAYRQYWGYLYTSNFDFVNYTPGVGGSSLNPDWGGAVWMSPTPITDHADDEITVDYQRYLVGLRGDLGKRWNWEFSAQYSRSDGDYVSDQIYDDSVNANAFGTESCVGSVTAVRGVPCLDIPWLDPQFLAGNVSPEMRDFLFGRERGNTLYTQWTAEAFMSGPVYELPAGEVMVAFGGQYQEDKIRDVPGEITLAHNAWGNTSAGITAGDDNTKAVYAEFEIPLVRGKPFMQDLTLTASGRYTDVASYGSGQTYKLGLNWSFNESWRLRMSQGTSFRTPALFELYLADQTSFLEQRSIDPCISWGTELAAGNISQRVADNCAADGLPADFEGGSVTATIITGGGLGVLKAETSTSRTIGLVWRPQFTDLSVSLDYFDIEVNDEVDQLGADQIVYGCYNSAFFGTDPLCSLFDRTGLNDGVDNVRDSYINIATQTNRGWDFNALWTTEIPWGRLTLETQHTYQVEDRRGLFADTIEDINGHAGEPKWVGRLSATLDHDPWTFYWGVNIVGKTSNYEHFGGDTATYRGETVRVVLDTGNVFYHSLSVARAFDSGLNVRFGISNVFNQEPPRVTTLDLGELDTIGKSAFYSQYDWLGRRYFLNLTQKF